MQSILRGISCRMPTQSCENNDQKWSGQPTVELPVILSCFKDKPPGQRSGAAMHHVIITIFASTGLLVEYL